MRARSLPLHLGVMDDFAPLGLVGLDVFRELLRRAGNRFEILPLEEILLDLGIAERLAHLGVDLGDDVRRHAGRAEQPEPRDRLVAGQPALRRPWALPEAAPCAWRRRPR